MTTYITVPVPEERVPEVYALLARLQGGPANRPKTYRERRQQERRRFMERRDRRLRGEVVALSRSLVIQMYDDGSPMLRAFMELLAEQPGEWVQAKEAAFALDLPHGSSSVAGMLGAFGRRANRRYKEAVPWELRRDGQNVMFYRVMPEVSCWIQEAARDHGSRTI